MRRAPALFVVVGVVAMWAGLPAQARADGFWVTLAAGVAGGSSNSDYGEFVFDSPHAPPLAVTQLTATGNVQAATAGGNTFFTGAGTPVLLPTTNGYATLSASGSSFPSSALPRFAGGTQASGAPSGGVPIPSNADHVALTLANPTANGSQVLTVGVTDPNGTALGQGQVTVPGGGWWVVGLGPAAQVSGDPTGGGGSGGTGGTGGGGTGGTGGAGGTGTGGTGGTGETGTGGGGNGAVTTPEPASIVLLGFGSLTAAGWRFRRRQTMS